MDQNHNAVGIHVGGVDLLDISNKNDDDEFTKWVLSRSVKHRTDLENQIIELQDLLGGNVFVELSNERVYIYYLENITFQIKMAKEGTCQSFENYLYLVEKGNKLIYSEKTVNKDSFLLVNFWLSFQKNALDDIMSSLQNKR